MNNPVEKKGCLPRRQALRKKPFLALSAACWLAAFPYASPARAAEPEKTAVLFQDGFSSLAPGMFSPGVVGAHAEYHYLPALAPKGGWVVSAFKSDGSQRAWRVVEHAGSPAMKQAYTSSAAEKAYTHPILIAGDPLWRDYRLQVHFYPLSDQAQSGMVFRYRNDQCYYFFGVAGGSVLLKKVQYQDRFHHLKETVLAQKDFPYSASTLLRAAVQVKGSHLRAWLGDQLVLQAEDATFAEGKIGLLADIPTVYAKVEVTASVEEERAWRLAKEKEANELGLLRNGIPGMALWKKIPIEGFGVGRNLRFGDLDGDGRTDILVGQVLHHGPKDRHSEVGCLTALTLEGKILWQEGEPDAWRDQLTNDVAMQIHDLDNDGRNEVIYCRNQQLIVADGASGKIRQQTSTPELSSRQPDNRYSPILGDSLYFCDLEGKGYRGNLLLKDRYRNLWAYDRQLKLLWHHNLNTGHYPYSADVDGDGKEEIAAGYSLLDHDGRLLWSFDKELQDHADGVAIVNFPWTDPPQLGILCAASDEGIYFADLQGRRRKHHYLGHVQNPTTAELRTDLAGLETVTINFWGNQGTLHFFNAQGDLYHSIEPVQQGSMLLPVNWTGSPPEFFVLSASTREGGLWDGMGRKVADFPADGHPELCNAVLDLTGDCRDEIVVWDPYEIWIYTQKDSPRAGRLFRPKRNPQCNQSNYQANVSLPGWNP